jgi:hypothetical protein
MAKNLKIGKRGRSEHLLKLDTIPNRELREFSQTEVSCPSGAVD